ncbi:MAG: thermonuclease family protein [Ruminococcaceae bacterium]|nr:thermonuclease family protein [Oscillospiraceae bacterium]
MKNVKRFLSLFLLLCLTVSYFSGCNLLPEAPTEPQATEPPTVELPAWIDFVEQAKLDMNSSTAKLEVTVKLFIDGDTTHFNVPESISADRTLKARYIAVNTPESTGQIEEWGKKASNFTREKLSNAESIIIESNTDQWERDSSGGRHMAWVWYKPKGETEYRNLNLELVQNGLSLASGSTTDLYGNLTQRAYTQAKQYKLNAFCGEPDPDFYYGGQIQTDLKTLRTNTKLFENKDVAFTGIIVRNNSQTVYVEQYDEETDMYYGMNVYYGYTSGEIDNILKVGNEVRFVGNVQYWEGGGTWQVTDVHYSAFDPDDPENLKLLGTGHTASNRLTDPDTFLNGTVTVDVPKNIEGTETEEKTFKYAELALSTSIRMEDLYVKSIYTTNNGGDNDGAMTFTCTTADGKTVDVRTTVLRKADKTLYTKDDFINKTISVTGIVDYFSGDYQIKVFSAKNIEIQ